MRTPSSRLTPALAAIALAVCLAPGCKRRVIERTAPSTQPAAAGDARPSTQALRDAPRRELALLYVPLKIRVPQDWKLENLRLPQNELHFLRGPGSRDDIRIQIATRPPLTATGLQILLEGANKEMAANPAKILKVELSTQGKLKVLERQRLGSVPPHSPSLAAAAGVVIDDSPLLEWTWTFLAPRGQVFDVYELNFIGLTSDDFKADQAFLRSLLGSVELSDAALPPL